MVTKCICSNVLFSEMKNIADKNALKSINELKKYIAFGDNCKLCIPYIEMMFKTGKTEFDPVTE